MRVFTARGAGGFACLWKISEVGVAAFCIVNDVSNSLFQDEPRFNNTTAAANNVTDAAIDVGFNARAFNTCKRER